MTARVRLLGKALAGLVVVAAVAWVADYAFFEYRVRLNRNPYGSVTVQEYYAIGEKNSRTEYLHKSTEQESCANSLFPHAGIPPCWHARKHTDKTVPI